MEKITWSILFGAILFGAAVYAIAWIAFLPAYGTLRCTNWNADNKCENLAPGPINFNYHFIPTPQ